MSLFAELKRRKVVRVGIAYAVIGWFLAQIAEFAFVNFGAPDWVLKTVVVVLLLGLPLAVFFAWAFEITPDGVKREKDVEHRTIEPLRDQLHVREIPPRSKDAAQEPKRIGTASRQSKGRGRWYFVAAASVLVVSYLAFDAWRRSEQHQLALVQLSAAHALTQQDRYGEAFVIARDLQQLIGTDPEFVALWEEITALIEPRIAESGAVVSFQPYEVADAEWTDLGTTPVTPTAAPLGVLRLRVEKPGFLTREFAVANPGPMLGNTPEGLEFGAPMPKIELSAIGEVPDEMIRVPATDFPIFLQGFSRNIYGDARFAIPAFAVGRSEVTNREYKAFVDDGGYSNSSYWSGMKLPDETPLNADAIAVFVDTTGRPGPANWELGSYPTGAGDLPVGALSWYEAKAYARYRGLALPTVHHWARVAFAPAEGGSETAPAISRASNFDASGPGSATSATGIGPWGTVNTAGNVREWVWNQAGTQALAMGGAWSDYPGLYQDVYTVDPLNRAPQNGLRLMHTFGEPIEPALLDPVILVRESELTRREPINDDAFEAMRFQFTHALGRPQSVKSEVIEQNDTWVAEEVLLSFGTEQVVTLYVVKPVGTMTKLQPVIYMPHGGAFEKMPNRDMLAHVPYLDFIVRAGRALVIPIWTNTAQRYTPFPKDPAAIADRDRRTALAWHEDAAIAIDYLETREDIDASGVGYVGTSSGAINGPIVLSMEQRFSAAILIAGGIPHSRLRHPMYDPINYAPRVSIPVLMVNGRYDHLFLYENSQKRMFDLLGTSAKDKDHLIFDTGHFDFPRNQVAHEVSDWFDRYLGPVHR